MPNPVPTREEFPSIVCLEHQETGSSLRATAKAQISEGTFWKPPRPAPGSTRSSLPPGPGTHRASAPSEEGRREERRRRRRQQAACPVAASLLLIQAGKGCSRENRRLAWPAGRAASAASALTSNLLSGPPLCCLPALDSGGC